MDKKYSTETVRLLLEHLEASLREKNEALYYASQLEEIVEQTTRFSSTLLDLLQHAKEELIDEIRKRDTVETMTEALLEEVQECVDRNVQDAQRINVLADELVLKEALISALKISRGLL